MHFLATPAALIGRILLSLIFIVAGAMKLGDIAGTEQYIQSVGLQSGLAIPTAIFELAAGILVLVGFLVRPMALLLAGFTVVTALFFHSDMNDPVQSAMFMKNLAIAGGFLCLFAYGNMAYSFDSVRAKRKADLETAAAREQAAAAEIETARNRADAAEIKDQGIRKYD